MEHLRVTNVNIGAAEDEDGDGETSITSPTLCLDKKALPAAEQIFLARYTLHEQVYLHKTTRCVEKMIVLLLNRVSELCKNSSTSPRNTGLPKGHPLLIFLRPDGRTLENYLRLDDQVVMGGAERMTQAADEVTRDSATRLRERRLYKVLDVEEFGANGGR
jgi:HD superfamily phosphohydrolase